MDLREAVNVRGVVVQSQGVHTVRVKYSLNLADFADFGIEFLIGHTSSWSYTPANKA